MAKRTLIGANGVTLTTADDGCLDLTPTRFLAPSEVNALVDAGLLEESAPDVTVSLTLTAEEAAEFECEWGASDLEPRNRPTPYVTAAVKMADAIREVQS